MKSTTTNIFFNQQKTDSGDASSIHHLPWRGVCSTEDYKHIHVIWTYDFFVFVQTFHFLNRTGMVLYVFSKHLMVSFVHLIFQVYKCLKWRVQPQTSFLTTKESIMAILDLFFWAFCRSYSSVLLLFFSRYIFFVFLKPRYVSFFFVLSCILFLASS